MTQRPNLILITTDQHRGDCLGCDGHPVLETPYLDELAEDGIRFAHAYSSVPSCEAARAAILTGMDPWNHGRLTQEGEDALEFPATLPGELARAGYLTRAVGRMMFFPPRRLYGFHHALLDEDRDRRDGFASDYKRWLGRRGEAGSEGAGWIARPSRLPESLHPTWWAAEEALWFLRQRDPVKPFFLWLSFSRPRTPYDAPSPYFELYSANPDLPRPVVGDWAKEFDRRIAHIGAAFSHRSEEEVRRARAGYYGNITFIDHQIGRVLDELRRNQVDTWNDTLVVFTSDHGDMLGDHHHWRHTYAYEGSARVPFLVRFPAAFEMARDRVLEQPVELRDVMPTFLDAAGLPIPECVDGDSVLHLACGETDDWREFVQGEHSESHRKDMAMQYVTDGREKFVWFHYTDREMFFDLNRDPLECHDLSTDPAVQGRMALWRERLADINEERGDPRGRNGHLFPQEGDAIALSPNYDKWKARAE
ncbi:MAG: arylsulfatase [FCB group bacterium]|jgi:arylsulfatase A-like enzyme|nr:arylsulfatase [FCB group bacterium]